MKQIKATGRRATVYPEFTFAVITRASRVRDTLPQMRNEKANSKTLL